MSSAKLHQGQPVLAAGEPLGTAHAAMILLHGRGASAEDILSLANEFPEPGVAFIAPQAANATWYPYHFMEPMEQNEPWLSSAFKVVDDLAAAIKAAGIDAQRILLLGFSQGACLTLEYSARHTQKYGGIVGLSGGLIGPEGTPREYAGNFEHTPVFLGCSDVDPHIPRKRVIETADVFKKMGADVTMRLYPNMEHTVNGDEIKTVRGMLKRVSSKQ